jgi:hypothetical protein
VEQRGVDVSSRVTDRFPHDQVGNTLDSARHRGGLRVVVEPTPAGTQPL